METGDLARHARIPRVRATVSGSFRRYMAEVQEAVSALTDAGVDVLSPADPRVVDAFGDFLFVASDRMRTVKVVQSRHLAAIDNSDFLWLVNPDGYVGPSAAMEIGFSLAKGVPVFSLTPPSDLTMRQFVTVVPSLEATASALTGKSQDMDPAAVLDPESAVLRGHELLDGLGAILTRAELRHREAAPEISAAARSLRQLVRGL